MSLQHLCFNQLHKRDCRRFLFYLTYEQTFTPPIPNKAKKRCVYSLKDLKRGLGDVYEPRSSKHTRSTTFPRLSTSIRTALKGSERHRGVPRGGCWSPGSKHAIPAYLCSSVQLPYFLKTTNLVTTLREMGMIVYKLLQGWLQNGCCFF